MMKLLTITIIREEKGENPLTQIYGYIAHTLYSLYYTTSLHNQFKQQFLELEGK